MLEDGQIFGSNTLPQLKGLGRQGHFFSQLMHAQPIQSWQICQHNWSYEGEIICTRSNRVTSDDLEWSLKVVPRRRTRNSVCVVSLVILTVWRGQCMHRVTRNAPARNAFKPRNVSRSLHSCPGGR